MNTLINLVNKKTIAFLFILAMPFVSFAESMSAEEEAARAAKIERYSEISIAILFAVAVVLFLIFKSKYDKKQRERAMKQMQQIQATRRKAA